MLLQVRFQYGVKLNKYEIANKDNYSCCRADGSYGGGIVLKRLPNLGL